MDLKRLEGEYIISFQGPFGTGHGSLVLKDGAIIGQTSNGMRLGGSYGPDNGRVRLDMTIGTGERQPHARSVLDGKEAPADRTISFTIPADLQGVRALEVETAFGPLLIDFNRM
jgi:hypothetical protein